jgi:hypothetical protein
VKTAVAFALALLSTACSANRDAPGSLSAVDLESPDEVLTALRSDGPDRFAMVSPGLYRGGAPSADDLELLRALGVTKIVDLRRGKLGKRRAEHAEARRLGMQHVEYPFYGTFGTDLQFLDDVVAELDTGGKGAVYVHCDGGKDRTSLVVALYRVAHDGWSPDLAWEREALAYGHAPTRLNRELQLTFQDYVHEHTLRTHTATGSGMRVQAVRTKYDAEGALVKSGGEASSVVP